MKISKAQLAKIKKVLRTHGGEGSGNFGHVGRPGKVGGSASLKGGRTSLKISEPELVNSAFGQQDFYLYAHTPDGKLAATLNYSVYKNKPHIQYVEAQQKGLGAGAELVRKLSNEYGYQNIEWGGMTESGFALQKKLDKEFGVERVFVSYDAKDIVKKYDGQFFDYGNFYGKFPSKKQTAVVGYLEKIGSSNIDIQDAGDYVYIEAELPDDKIVVRKKK